MEAMTRPGTPEPSAGYRALRRTGAARLGVLVTTRPALYEQPRHEDDLGFPTNLTRTRWCRYQLVLSEHDRMVALHEDDPTHEPYAGLNALSHQASNAAAHLIATLIPQGG
jgi:hypothetical protein